MSLKIGGYIDRTISDSRIERVKNSHCKEDAIQMGVWDKVKDWFCGSHKKEALSHLYDITHDIEQSTSSNAAEKMAAFAKLSMLAEGRSALFHGQIISIDDARFAFEFEIEGVLEKTCINYGELSEEAKSIFMKQLTNSSGYLLEENVKKFGVNGALKHVSFDNKTELFEGITDCNQERLSISLLPPESKKLMAEDKSFAQQWIETQLKCFDYFSDQQSKILKVGELTLDDVGGTHLEWLSDSAQSFNQLSLKMNQYLAEQQVLSEPKPKPSPLIKNVVFNVDSSKPTQVERLLPNLVAPPRNDDEWDMLRDQEGEKRYKEITNIIYMLEDLRDYQNKHCNYQLKPDFQYSAPSGDVRSDFHRAGDKAKKDFFEQAIHAGYDLNNKGIYSRVETIAGMYHSLNYQSMVTTTGILLR
ncbi:hypothetical protein [Vibrio aquimaris]|uniref:Outer protein D n=1 Tax=Vibrio aquimaris TaxID=2587862 RepID=A0A5P9CJ18_9VIBR|nr:hypothetical protein [Vibrio aquimaris]QFT26224.1 Outer protein D [Vibrio aquimaris]